MQKTKIEWVRNPDGSHGYSWNPIQGLCPGNCWYCYGIGLTMRFNRPIIPYFDESIYQKIFQPIVRKARGIFVCSTFDLFHPITETIYPPTLLGSLCGDSGNQKFTWRDLIFQAIEKYSEHRFYILTKFPQNIDRPMPDNVWLGVSITEPKEMAPRIKNLYRARAKLRFISFEPLLGDVGQFRFQGWLNGKADWIIVGRLTQHGHKNDPKDYWIQSIINHSKKFNTPIFLKDNLKEIWGEPLIQEFP